jgi:hypothetical protein
MPFNGQKISQPSPRAILFIRVSAMKYEAATVRARRALETAEPGTCRRSNTVLVNF